MLVVERSDTFGLNFVLNLTNYRSSVGQHVFLGIHFTICTKVCRRLMLVTPRTMYCFSPGQTRVIYGLLRASEFGSLEEDNFCKRTKNLSLPPHAKPFWLLLFSMHRKDSPTEGQTHRQIVKAYWYIWWKHLMAVSVVYFNHDLIQTSRL